MRTSTFGWRDNAYGSIFYMIIGLHALARARRPVHERSSCRSRPPWASSTTTRHVTLEVFGLYWHFVDVVWIFVFSSL